MSNGVALDVHRSRRGDRRHPRDVQAGPSRAKSGHSVLEMLRLRLVCGLCVFASELLACQMTLFEPFEFSDADEVVQLLEGNQKVIYRVRALLETEAARLGTAKITDQAIGKITELLHRMGDAARAGDIPTAARAEQEVRHMLYAVGGNSILVDLIDQAWNLFPGSILWNIPGRIKQSLKEHRNILDAVSRRDPTAAAHAIENHLLSALGALEAYASSFTKRTPSSPRSQF